MEKKMESQPNLSESSSSSQTDEEFAQRNHKTHASITVGKSPAEVFRFFRDFSHLPKFMKDIARIEIIDAVTSDWMMTLKSGETVRWTTKITAEHPDQMIYWKSIDGSEIETLGSLWLSAAPAGLGTLVELRMDYTISGGKLSELVTYFSSENPKVLLLANMHRLKSVLETGEYPTVEGQASGRDELPETVH